MMMMVGTASQDKNLAQLSHIAPFFHSTCAYLFYLYIYPPDSQESVGGAIHRTSNYPHLLPEMSRYCCLLEIYFYLDIFVL